MFSSQVLYPFAMGTLVGFSYCLFLFKTVPKWRIRKVKAIK